MPLGEQERGLPHVWSPRHLVPHVCRAGPRCIPAQQRGGLNAQLGQRKFWPGSRASRSRPCEWAASGCGDEVSGDTAPPQPGLIPALFPTEPAWPSSRVLARVGSGAQSLRSCVSLGA